MKWNEMKWNEMKWNGMKWNETKRDYDAVEIDSKIWIDKRMQTRPVSNFDRHGKNTFVPTIFERRKRSVFGATSGKKVENFANCRPCILTGGGKSWATSTYLDIRVHILSGRSLQHSSDASEIREVSRNGMTYRFPFITQSHNELLFARTIAQMLTIS